MGFGLRLRRLGKILDYGGGPVHLKVDATRVGSELIY